MATVNLAKRPLHELEGSSPDFFPPVPICKRVVAAEKPPRRPPVFPHIDLPIEDHLVLSRKETYTQEEVRQMLGVAMRISEARLREEYDRILTQKLQEQFQCFSQFQHDYVAKQYGTSNATYFS